MASRDVIHIFLASPGDVARERDIASEVVTRVNSDIAATFGFYIDLYGWEQQPPGFGRPQDQINPQLERADLFVGLLWRTWGSPPGGEHGSGFEEEFDLARGRRLNTGHSPEMWLFFRDVDPGQLTDAGEKLQRVLAFRKRIEDDHVCLYQTYEDEERWGERFYRLLVQYIARQAKSRENPEPDRAVATAPAEHETSPRASSLGAHQRSAAQQLASIDKVRDILLKGNEPPELIDSARLLLASFTWVSDRTREVLGTHEQNLLYRMRTTLEPTHEEQLQLVRSMLLGEGVRPGWFWVGKFERLNSPDLVFAYLAILDNNPSVRRRALELMLSPDALNNWPEDSPITAGAYLRGRLSDPDVDVRGATLDLAARWGSDDALTILEEARARSETKTPAGVALARLLLRRSPDEALAIAAADRFVGHQLEDDFLADANAFSNEAIDTLRTHELAASRVLALRLDRARQTWTEGSTRAALSDLDHDVQREALDNMFAAGWKVDDKRVQEIAGDFLLPTNRKRQWRTAHAKQKGERVLRDRLNWYYVWSESTYSALATQHFPTFGEQVRRDLSDGFETFRRESVAFLQSNLPAQDVTGFIGIGSGDSAEPRRRELIIAGLEGLEAHGVPRDAEIVQSYLGHNSFDVRFAAIRALAGIGHASASQEAVRLAQDTEATPEVAQLALALEPDSALVLSRSDDANIMALAARHLRDIDQHRDRLHELLYESDDAVRLAAVSRLGSVLDHRERSDLLDRYVAQEQYFYNVVAWLDCLTYAPGSFQVRYLAEM